MISLSPSPSSSSRDDLPFSAWRATDGKKLARRTSDFLKVGRGLRGKYCPRGLLLRRRQNQPRVLYCIVIPDRSERRRHSLPPPLPATQTTTSAAHATLPIASPVCPGPIHPRVPVCKLNLHPPDVLLGLFNRGDHARTGNLNLNTIFRGSYCVVVPLFHIISE